MSKKNKSIGIKQKKAKEASTQIQKVEHSVGKLAWAPHEKGALLDYMLFKGMTVSSSPWSGTVYRLQEMLTLSIY